MQISSEGEEHNGKKRKKRKRKEEKRNENKKSKEREEERGEDRLLPPSFSGIRRTKEQALFML